MDLSWGGRRTCRGGGTYVLYGGEWRENKEVITNAAFFLFSNNIHVEKEDFFSFFF